MIKLSTVAVACLAGVALAPVANALERDRAELAASMLHEACTADNARLWGESLCGPLIVVDPKSRRVWANEADAAGVLAADGVGFIGELPQSATVANTSVEWAGKRWIMLVAPLPDDDARLRVLAAHEAFHRIQDKIGLPPRSPSPAHLETEEGRRLLRLELRALRAAMESAGRTRLAHARRALDFRAARHAAFPGAATEETALDRNEGLAEYTGVKLGAGADAAAYTARSLAHFDGLSAFARTFSYATGPAYGLLLDAAQPDWRTRLAQGAAPADLLAQAIGFEPSRTLSRAERIYGGWAVAEEERVRAEAHAARVARLTAAFQTEPRLIIPLQSMRMEFNPTRVTPIEGLGTIYGGLTVRDVWGELRAAGDALINSTFSATVVAAPNAEGAAGADWSLSLNPGFEVSPPDETGARRVRRVAP